MTLTGKQKAALLLMSLDAATAAQMVKGLDSRIVEERSVTVLFAEPLDCTLISRSIVWIKNGLIVNRRINLHLILFKDFKYSKTVVLIQKAKVC